MRKLFSLLIAVGLAFCSRSQNPVQWNYSAKKTGDKTYKIQLTATIQSPWHIYSQTTADGGPLPTKISFNKNPLLTLTGNPTETGKLIKEREEVFDIDVKYFNGNVTFTQTVILKAAVKTNIGGTIEFMACNDKQCMPPAIIPFTVMLQ
jgi:thiol:disulfide interchange protein DsbD